MQLPSVMDLSFNIRDFNFNFNLLQIPNHNMEAVKKWSLNGFKIKSLRINIVLSSSFLGTKLIGLSIDFLFYFIFCSLRNLLFSAAWASWENLCKRKYIHIRGTNCCFHLSIVPELILSDRIQNVFQLENWTHSMIWASSAVIGVMLKLQVNYHWILFRKLQWLIRIHFCCTITFGLVPNH